MEEKKEEVVVPILGLEPKKETDEEKIKRLFDMNVAGKVEKRYPCLRCGLEKIRATGTGNIPQYCKECLPKVRSENIQKTILDKKKLAEEKATIEVQMLDGTTTTVSNEKERLFIEGRTKQYLDDFEWKQSSDLGLLKSLVLLELQSDRISRILTKKYTVGMSSALAELSQEIRKCQSELGISRSNRLDEKSKTDAYTLVANMISRFKDYQKKYPERFMWKCKHCGKINDTNKENPDSIKTGEMKDGVGIKTSS